MVIWFTGQPGSGKTTLCENIMLNMSSDVFHIDGDDLRNLFDNKDYSEVGRRKNIELAQQISEYLTNKGKHVLVSLVSPYKDQRDKFKQKMGDKLIEVYVRTSEIRGRENFFVENYEPPTEDYIDIDTTNVDVKVCTDLILEYAKNSR
jgi:adenylylsulfate kinase